MIGELTRRNPDYGGKANHEIDNTTVVSLRFVSDQVSDIEPLRALKGLKVLSCAGSSPGRSKLADLTPLRDLPLEFLNVESTRVLDLAPLKKMPLTKLLCNNTQVADLTPLKGLPLVGLECAGTPVTDLSPVQGLPLKWLACPIPSERNARVLQTIKSLETINGKPAAEFWKQFSPKQ